jgi:predicted nucleic acid-binding protein
LNAWVLDPSVALAWGLPDEQSEVATDFLESLRPDDVFWVPALWWYEMSDALTVARRRHRVTEAESARLVELYGSLPVQTDPLPGREALVRLTALAARHDLATYDAAYLELASRRGIGLATLDEAQARAAAADGVPLALT